MRNFSKFLGVLTLIALAGKCYAQAPLITSFSPASGPVGTTVTITGRNFNTTAGNNIVFFGSVKAAVTVNSSTSLTVAVPVGASYQPLSVLNFSNGLSGYSSLPFRVTFSTDLVIPPATPYVLSSLDKNPPPISIQICDVDGDGKPDILMLDNEDGGSIVIYQNLTPEGVYTPVFSTGYPFATANTGPSVLKMMDVNGDGKPDLLVGYAGSLLISIFLNQSVPGAAINYNSFASNVDFSINDGTNSYPTKIEISDLDGDGKPDIIVSNGETFDILRNTTSDSTVSFAPKVVFPFEIYNSSLAVGDLDNDGKPDIVTTNYTNNSISVYHYIAVTGSITAASFAPKVDYGMSSSPSQVFLADFDGDGKTDIAAVASGITIFHNNSTPGVINSSSFGVPQTFAGGGSTFVIGDIDGNGKPDIVTSYLTNDGFYSTAFFQNISTSGTINFNPEHTFPGSLSYGAFALGDVNGDGKLDIVYPGSIFLNNPPVPYVPIVPTIQSFNPPTGPIGTTVYIKGSNFNTTAANNIVYFGATRATVTAATDSTLSVTVPAGAILQPFSVLNTTLGTSGVSAKPFITTFSPSKPKVLAKDFDPVVNLTPQWV